MNIKQPRTAHTATRIAYWFTILALLLAVGILVYALVSPLQSRAQTTILTSTLDLGDSGSNVTIVQTFLAGNPAIYPEGLVTGYFGPLTAAAVERYQCNKGIVCQGTPETTGYGRVGPSTLTAINADLSGTGLPGTPPPTGTPPSGDVHAPIQSAETVSTTTGSATIAWTTNEPANHRVMYGTVWPFLYATAPSFYDPSFDASANVILTALAPNTTYYYVRESVDSAGNIMWTLPKTFTTF